MVKEEAMTYIRNQAAHLVPKLHLQLKQNWFSTIWTVCGLLVCLLKLVTSEPVDFKASLINSQNDTKMLLRSNHFQCYFISSLKPIVIVLWTP